MTILFRVSLAVLVILGLLGWVFSAKDMLVNPFQQENSALAEKNKKLEEEIKKLKETAQYHYQNGIDKLDAYDYQGAAESFKTVIDKYPNDPLVVISKRHLAMTEKLQEAVMVEQKNAEAMTNALIQKEAASAGEYVDYGEFYAIAKTGMKIGKRYRFNACLNNTPCLSSIDSKKRQVLCSLDVSTFDDGVEYKQHLASGYEHCGAIVAGMMYPGEISIFRLH